MAEQLLRSLELCKACLSLIITSKCKVTTVFYVISLYNEDFIKKNRSSNHSSIFFVPSYQCCTRYNFARLLCLLAAPWTPVQRPWCLLFRLGGGIDVGERCQGCEQPGRRACARRSRHSWFGCQLPTTTANCC